MPHPDAKIIALIVKHHESMTAAAAKLGVSFHRFRNWIERGVPAGYRLKVRELANRYGAKLGLDWLDVAQPSTSTSEGKTNGRESKGKRKAAQGRKGQGKVQRRRSQQRRHPGRGAAALVG